MKKILALGLVCVLLALCLLIPLWSGAAPEPPSPTEAAGPTGTTEAQTVPPATEAPEPRPLGLVEVTGLELGEDEGLFGLCAADGMGYLMLQRWDQQAQASRYRLLALDPETAAVASETELKDVPQDAGFDRLKVTQTEILLLDEYGERCAAYDRSGRFLGLRDYPVMSRDNRGWQNRLLNDDCFWKDTDFASYTDSGDTELSRVVAFYDEANRLHALRESYSELAAADGHRVLTRAYGEGSLRCVLYDFDAELRVGEAVLSASDVDGAQWVNPWGAAIGEDWILLAAAWNGEAVREPEDSAPAEEDNGPEDPAPAEEDNGPEDPAPAEESGEPEKAASVDVRRILFWYPDPEERRPLDQEIWTEERFSQGIAALKTELEALGMTLHLDEAPAKEQTPTTGLAVSESVCDTGASLFGQYRVLSHLKTFTDKLPEGFIRELWSEMPGNAGDRDSLHIYVVRNIPGDAAGFANAWIEPMMICFATEEFNNTHLAHEFMHVMEYRLSQYFYTKWRDMEDEWLALSPYYGYNTDLTPAQAEKLEGYFVSLYARTNTLEDRAETFQQLFDSETPAAEASWYADRPGVQAKVKWLTDSIRAAFPSVQAVEQAWWELPLNGSD